jgi:hypothetical protein
MMQFIKPWGRGDVNMIQQSVQQQRVDDELAEK